MHDWITNAASYTNSAGFSPPADWGYDSPASWYFWAGFVCAFGLGLVSLTLTWVRRLVGGGNSEL